MYVDKQTSFMRRIDRLVQLVALRFYNIPTKLRLLSGTVLALRAFMTSFRGAVGVPGGVGRRRLPDRALRELTAPGG